MADATIGKPIIQYFSIMVLLFALLVAIYIVVGITKGVETIMTILGYILVVLAIILIFVSMYRLFSHRTLIGKHILQYGEVEMVKPKPKSPPAPPIEVPPHPPPIVQQLKTLCDDGNCLPPSTSQAVGPGMAQGSVSSPQVVSPGMTQGSVSATIRPLPSTVEDLLK